MHLRRLIVAFVAPRVLLIRVIRCRYLNAKKEKLQAIPTKPNMSDNIDNRTWRVLRICTDPERIAHLDELTPPPQWCDWWVVC